MPKPRPAPVAGVFAVSNARSRWFVLLAVLLGVRPALADAPVVDPRFTLTDSTETHSPGHGKAVIRLVREQYVRANSLPPEMIYLDGEPAGLLPQKSWLELEVEPGPHRLCGLQNDAGMWLNCRPDRAYFLRLREVIDSQDQRSESWLLDAGGAAAGAIRQKHLWHVETSEPGMGYLLKKKRSVCPDEKPVAVGGPVAVLPDSFDHVLLERPLAQVNLERDFSLLSGHARLDSTGVHYRLQARIHGLSLRSSRMVSDSLEIPADRILGVRFGGTRFTGSTPWVDILYQAGSEMKVASFADIRAEYAVSTYNAIFRAALELRALQPPHAEDGESLQP